MARTVVFHLTAFATLLLSALPGGLFAQNQADLQPVRGPVLGFVFDRAAGVRPILGVPGAATLGRPVMSNLGFESVVFSQTGGYALALLARGRGVALLRDLSSSGQATELPVAPGAARVAISPSGDSAVLYYQETQTVQVLAGLPDAPSIAWNMQAPCLAEGLAALAVSDEAGAVLVAAAGDQTPVWLLAPDVGCRILFHVSSSPSFTFLTRSFDAWIADGGASSVALLRNVKSGAQVTQIVGAAEGISHPVAVAVSADNRRVLVANADPAGVVSLSLAGEERAALPCDCALTGLERLAGGTTFRLSDPGEGPLWLLDAGDSPPRMVFVPSSSPTPLGVVRVPRPIRRGGDR